jgi:hypothetical protein
MKSHEGHRSGSPSEPPPEFGVTSRLNEWKINQWSDTLESIDSEDQSLWNMIKVALRVTRSPSPHLQAPGGLAL